MSNFWFNRVVAPEKFISTIIGSCHFMHLKSTDMQKIMSYSVCQALHKHKMLIRLSILLHVVL